jgi:hypothetical protein
MIEEIEEAEEAGEETGVEVEIGEGVVGGLEDLGADQHPKYLCNLTDFLECSLPVDNKTL